MKVAYTYFEKIIQKDIILLSLPIEPAYFYSLKDGLPCYEDQGKIQILIEKGFKIRRAKPQSKTIKKMQLSAFSHLTNEYFTLEKSKDYPNKEAWELAINIFYICLVGMNFEFFSNQEKYQFLVQRFKGMKPTEIYYEILNF